jgi:hypothetical protein
MENISFNEKAFGNLPTGCLATAFGNIHSFTTNKVVISAKV